MIEFFVQSLSQIITWILFPLFFLITRLRNYLYKINILKTYKVSVPILSVGNLTMGGTGKTPFTIWLLDLLEKDLYWKELGVVVRNYKSNELFTSRVVMGQNSASIFGDEAVLIQQKMRNAKVFSGPQKFKTAQKLLEEEPQIQAIVVDDGFQHFKLHRDFNIVLCDVSVSPNHYQFLPTGRLRESFEALERADVLVFTKTELKNLKTYNFLLQKVNILKTQMNPNLLVIESSQDFKNIEQIAGKSVESTVLSSNSIKDFFGFAGLAHPRQFKESVMKQGFGFIEFVALKDHVTYDETLISQLIQLSNGAPCLTTEKDAVKLREKWPFHGPPLFVLPLEVKIKNEDKLSLIKKLKEKFNN